MYRKSNFAIVALNAAPLLTATCVLLGAPAIGATIDAGKDNRDALSDLKKPLKTVVPNAEQRKPPKYVIELKATQTVRPLGKDAVQNVEIPLERIKMDGAKEESDETGVLIEHPALDTLIPLEENLNPFSLDARYIEKISLKDTLEAALGQNLDIEEGCHFTWIRADRPLPCPAAVLNWLSILL